MVVALEMIVFHEFVDAPPQVTFTERDYLLLTRFLDGPQEVLGVRIQVR